MYISTIYVRSCSFAEKKIVVNVKKTKQISQKALFLALNFVFFTQPKRQVNFSYKDFVRT
jgi:hypothetical protein